MKCSAQAWHKMGRWGKWNPCSRNAKVERDGKPYCTQHDPERIARLRKERMDAASARWERQDRAMAVREAQLLAANLVERGDATPKELEAARLRILKARGTTP